MLQALEGKRRVTVADANRVLNQSSVAGATFRGSRGIAHGTRGEFHGERLNVRAEGAREYVRFH